MEGMAVVQTFMPETGRKSFRRFLSGLDRYIIAGDDKTARSIIACNIGRKVPTLLFSEMIGILDVE